MTYATLLPNRGILRITGKDRAAFLQGLITNDVEKITLTQGIYAALLSPQGKFQYDFFIVASTAPKGEESWLLVCDLDRIDALHKRLFLYKLRSEVTLENLNDEFSITAFWGSEAFQRLNLTPQKGATITIDGGIAFVDPRLKELGAHIILPQGRTQNFLESRKIDLTSYENYDLHRLKLGIPDGIQDVIIDRGVLLECGFDELGAIDWDKGCYMGQELTARTRYRGLVRKRLIPVRIQGTTPSFQSLISQDGKEVGELRTAQKDWGIAMIRLEALSKPLPFRCEDATLIPHIPDWMCLPSLNEEQ